MKKRLEALENALPPENPGAKLLEIGKRWRAAAVATHFKKAATIRDEAETIFDGCPRFKNKPPKWTLKNLYIDWDWFVHYNDSRARKYYNRAVIEGYWPDNFHQWRAKKR